MITKVSSTMITLLSKHNFSTGLPRITSTTVLRCKEQDAENACKDTAKSTASVYSAAV